MNLTDKQILDWMQKQTEEGGVTEFSFADLRSDMGDEVKARAMKNFLRFWTKYDVHADGNSVREAMSRAIEKGMK